LPGGELQRGIDANVPYPFALRDTLLRPAELELYVPLWSARILEETRAALLEYGLAPEQPSASSRPCERRSRRRRWTRRSRITRLEPAMTNDPDDRHVLAAAVAARHSSSATSGR
jgi:hypothetical protein